MITYILTLIFSVHLSNNTTNRFPMKDLIWILVILLLTGWYLFYIVFNIEHILVSILLFAATILSLYNIFFCDKPIKK
ncbi:hypothetical protein HMPREF9714_00776 [Myroides odoratimimus CCUG 12901]|nr:hypothetical protein MYRA21_1884 [Myroides sp. A21]EHO13512.1 hypothetical protein HMPREF9714_00776 [Myroides odoratimimus CCUG 12901]SHM30341.1 hypothetical protein SAMN05444275_11190 [Myroides odoratimimus subsp. xuanwuensis]